MESRVGYSYFHNPADPSRPIYARTVWGSHKGLKPLSRHEAAALMEKTPSEAPGTPPSPDPAQVPPDPAPPLPQPLRRSQGHFQTQEATWTMPPVAIQPMLMTWPQPTAAEGLRDNHRDIERREAAKARIKDAVLAAARTTLDDQMRYELALQARNENMRAMELFEPEARILGTTVAELADRIIQDRRTRERRMMHAWAVLRAAEAALDAASGPAIDRAAEAALADIQRES